MRNFNWMRWIRIGLGAYMLLAAWFEKQWFYVPLGALLLLQGAFNMGCAAGNCAVPPHLNRETKKTEDVSYEEVLPRS